MIFSTSMPWWGSSPILWLSPLILEGRWSSCWEQTGKLTSLIWSWTSWRWAGWEHNETDPKSELNLCAICNRIINREVFSTDRGSSIRPTYWWTHSDWTGQGHDHYSGWPAHLLSDRDCLLCTSAIEQLFNYTFNPLYGAKCGPIFAPSFPPTAVSLTH